MEELGHTLREARERLGLTLEEVERATRIRDRHLQSLERGDFSSLPSPVQARGFLHNYAEFLGLDADQVLLRYADGLRRRVDRARANSHHQEAPTRPSVQVRTRRPRWLTSDLFVAAGITLAILVVLVWGGGRVMAALRERNDSESSSSFLLPSPTVPTATSTALPQQTPAALGLATELATATGTPAPVVGPTNVVSLRIVVEKRAWVWVLVDGQEAFRGRAAPGEILEYQADERVEVTTGNAGGLRVFYRGQDQGLLGELGQVMIRVWTLEGVLTPTPTQTRTPTATPLVTPTHTPTIPRTPRP